MVRLLARVIGVGVETADMLVQEVPRAAASHDGRLCTERSEGLPKKGPSQCASTSR